MSRLRIRLTDARLWAKSPSDDVNKRTRSFEPLMIVVVGAGSYEYREHANITHLSSRWPSAALYIAQYCTKTFFAGATRGLPDSGSGIWHVRAELPRQCHHLLPLAALCRQPPLSGTKTRGYEMGGSQMGCIAQPINATDVSSRWGGVVVSTPSSQSTCCAPNITCRSCRVRTCRANVSHRRCVAIIRTESRVERYAR